MPLFGAGPTGPLSCRQTSQGPTPVPAFQEGRSLGSTSWTSGHIQLCWQEWRWALGQDLLGFVTDPTPRGPHSAPAASLQHSSHAGL